MSERLHVPETIPHKPDSPDHQSVLLSAFAAHGSGEPPNLAGLNPNKPDLEQGEELFEQGASLLSGGGGKAVTHRDHGFAVLFYMCTAFCLVCFVLFYVFNIGAGAAKTASAHRLLGPKVCAALFGSATIAFGMSVVWLAILSVAAKWLIKITIVFAPCALLSASVMGFARGWVSVGAVSLGLLLLQLAWLTRIWRRAELAATTIGVTVSFSSIYPGVYGVAAGSLVGQFIWLWIWSKAATTTVLYFGSTTTMGKLLVPYFVFMLFWGVQVLKNIVHVTTCGAFASWYFQYPNNPEASPTLNALNKACTTSFGSVVLGSLLVAIVRSLRMLLNLFCQNWDSMPSCLSVPCRYCFVCIEKLTEYFNVYAFVNVAVYQRSYFEAAKHTCGFVKEAGVDALINNEFVDQALTLGAFCGGVVCGVFPALVGTLSSSQAMVVMVLGSALGYSIICGVLTVVWSCVVTLFVCFAEDALVLYHTKPDVFHVLVNAWQQRYDVKLSLDESVMTASAESVQQQPAHTIDECDAPSLEQHSLLLGHANADKDYENR